MYKKQTKVVNQTGLHARPAATFVQTAKKYEAKITVRRPGGAAVNAKSIVRLLAEEIGQGTEIEISAEGGDAQQAVDELVALVEGGFEE